jgi:hypothetical protein
MPAERQRTTTSKQTLPVSARTLTIAQAGVSGELHSHPAPKTGTLANLGGSRTANQGTIVLICYKNATTLARQYQNIRSNREGDGPKVEARELQLASAVILSYPPKIRLL